MSEAADRRAPTMADVAKVAGVSHQTVSRVLSDHPNVRESTRTRVREVIAELDYRPNQAARALVTKRSRTLGVVAANTTLYGPASILAGLEHAARDKGYLIATVSLDELSETALRKALEHLAAWGVEGGVVMTPHERTVTALLRLAAPFPIVTVEGGHDLDVPGVALDQYAGARMVTEHLLSLGHSSVWHVAGPREWLEAEGRFQGWRAALDDAGAPVPQYLSGDWSAASGYQAGKLLAAAHAGLDRASRPTAVFVANDHMALGVLRALREAGLRVPEDVAVAGFDGLPESDYFAPPLTTVRQDFAAIGRAGVELLLQRIEDPSTAPVHTTLPPELVVRSSTGAPAGR
ncbi:LacI family DNA-binding transcriptional regulator [Kitasatospora sp. NBC_01287]|uniref:LacI family DNA-binding transcriptional regulator n=1 Tax=Kitasatospora sp. NBC_01287 TaxID=2903573 RepID=UPI002258214B|nr:LacI family DNA-binding transcriptional regulator [Kitasatospora sp. NBC_01287]MCX4744712.1 LacI family DNA-binding transcriptional regulator [Kitasatospora sp. NBC_01287]